MASAGAVGQSVPYAKNADKNSSSGLVLQGEHDPGRTGVLEGDFLVRPKGTSIFYKGFACIVLSDWRDAASTSIDMLDDYVAKAAANGQDPEEAERAYNAMLVSMAEIVVAKANGTGDPEIAITESGNFQYSTKQKIKPRGTYRFYLPTRAERLAMIQTGEKLDQFRAYYGAPILEEIPAAEQSASSDLYAMFSRFLNMPDKMKAFDRVRESNFTGEIDPAVLLAFQIILNFCSMSAIFGRITGLAHMPLRNTPVQVVPGTGNAAILDLHQGQFDFHQPRDVPGGVFNLDRTNRAEVASSVRTCYYAEERTVAPAQTGALVSRPRINPDEFYATVAMYLGVIAPDDESEERASEEVLTAFCREMFKPYFSSTPGSGTDYEADSSVTPHSRIGVNLDEDGKFVQDISQVTNGGVQSFDNTSRIGRLALAAQANGMHGMAHTLYIRGARSTAATKVIASPSCNSVGNGNSMATYVMSVIGH